MSAVAPTSSYLQSLPAAGRPSIVQRFDTLALGIGSRITASTLLLACVLTIVIGASSMLDTLQKMDRDLKTMNEQLAIANKGTDVLNLTLDALPPTAEHLHDVVATVEGTSAEVSESKQAITKLADTTTGLVAALGEIATQTAAMRGSLERVDGGTATLGATVSELNTRIDPLVATQHRMLGETRRMKGGLQGMNASLAYTIRTLNYMSAPPTGRGFTVRVDLDKRSLPPIPGVKATTDPVEVFPRGAWETYGGL